MNTQNELERTGNTAREQATTHVVAPKVDVYENADEYLLVADLPGVERESLDVSWAKGELTLEGQHGARYYRRTFTVPDGIDSEHILADLQHGVLTLHLPKAPEVKPRKIQVRAA